MNFLRRRLFVAYGMLLGILGMFPGSTAGSWMFPPAHSSDVNSIDLRSQSTIPVILAHVLLVGFLVYLHTRRADAAVLEQTPRSWLVFSYGAYAIGVALGVVVAAVMR